MRVNGGQPVRVATPEGATSPNWSASRNLIAYISSARPVGSAPPRAVLGFVTPEGHAVATAWGDEPRLGNGSVVWSPDGQVVARGMSRFPPTRVGYLGVSHGRENAAAPDSQARGQPAGQGNRLASGQIETDRGSIGANLRHRPVRSGLIICRWPVSSAGSSPARFPRRRSTRTTRLRLQRHQPAGAAARAGRPKRHVATVNELTSE